MRYKEFLNESESLTDTEIIDLIHKDCSEYFKYIKYGVKSFRGARNPTNKTIIKKTPRSDRTPADMPTEIHNWLDNKLKKKFGWFPRTSGVFVTGSFTQSQGYGRPHYFYPSNGFKMIWNTQITDVWQELEDNDFVMFGKKEILNSGWIPYMEKYILKTYTSGTAKDINKALQSYNEIMFKCDFYYLVSTDFVTKNFDEIYTK